MSATECTVVFIPFTSTLTHTHHTNTPVVCSVQLKSSRISDPPAHHTILWCVGLSGHYTYASCYAAAQHAYMTGFPQSLSLVSQVHAALTVDSEHTTSRVQPQQQLATAPLGLLYQEQHDLFTQQQVPENSVLPHSPRMIMRVASTSSSSPCAQPRLHGLAPAVPWSECLPSCLWCPQKQAQCPLA